MLRIFPMRFAPKSLVIVGAALLWGAASRAVLADDSGENQDENIVKTVTSSEESVEARRVPSGFVTRVRIDGAAQNGRDLSDVLEEVPGVNMRRSAGFGRPAFASVRGGSSRQLAVSLNGMRIRAPAGIGFDIGSLSLAGLDSADVFRGSAAVVHGSGGLSGALDLQTRLPRGNGESASATAMAGSFETYGVTAKSALSRPDYALRLDANWRRSRDDFDFIDAQGVGHQRVNNDHWTLGLNGAGRIALGAHELKPLLSYEMGEGGAPGPSEFQGRYRDARLDQDRLIAQLGWERPALLAADWGAVDARALAGYQRRGTAYGNPHGFLGNSEVEDASTVESLVLNAETGIWLELGNMIHANLEGRREVYGATHRIDYPSSREDSAIDATRHTFAAALSNELLLGGEALSLVAGLRAEYIGDASTPSGHVLDAEILNARTWTPLMPSFGALWRATRWLKLKGNIARTFRAPDFDELYLDMAGVRGKSDLEPERALSWDGGLDLGAEKSPISAELVWFQSEIEESIYFVARTAYLFEAANLGSGHSRGVEATFRLHPHRRFNVRATYTWTDAWLDAMAAGTPIPGQPAHQSSARAEVELGGKGGIWVLAKLPSARIFAQTDWRSRVYLDSFANLYNPPFWTVDVGASLAPIDGWEVALNARNLSDQRRGADSLQRPLPGRAFYLSLKVEFGEIK